MSQQPLASPAPGGLSALYRAFWKFSAGHRHRVAMASSLLVASQLVKLIIPWLAAQAINAIQLSGGREAAHAGWLVLCILLVAGLSWALHGPGRVIERSVGIRVRERLSDDLYARVSRLPLAWHEAHHTGETHARLEKAGSALFNFAQSQFIYLQNLVNLAGPLVALTLLSGAAGLLAFTGYALIALVILRFDRSLLHLAERENAAYRRYSAALVDCLGNVGTVVSLRLQDATRAILGTRLAQSYLPFRRSLVLIEAKWCAVDLMSIALAWGLVALYALLAGRTGEALLLGNLFMVYQYAQQAGGVIGALASHYQNFTRMRVDYASAEPVWNAAERRRDGMIPPSDWRTVQVDGLDFRYGSRPALSGVQLTWRRGQRIALVGGSGAGKTTLMRVLAGLYDADSVCFGFDGVLYPGVRDLSSLATLIPQEAQLFDGSVRDNLTFGAAVSDEAVQAAVRIAGLDTVLAGLPGGLDAPVSERGLTLSGGQKQRIALARGILAAAGSSVIMLDEPTSSLDPVTEAEVITALCAAFPDATIVTSVHRMHLLSRFDTVVLMAAGRVVDSGTPAELLERQGLFRELWQRSAAQAPPEDRPLRAA